MENRIILWFKEDITLPRWTYAYLFIMACFFAFLHVISYASWDPFFPTLGLILILVFIMIFVKPGNKNGRRRKL